MSIANRLSIAALSLGVAMSAASAGYTVTQIDCTTEDYTKQVERYTEQMAAADKMNNQDLYAQARDARDAAADNAKACALMNQHPVGQ